MRRFLGAVAALVRPRWPIAAVLALYAASAFVVPTMAPVTVGDDWVYARSVEILVRQHQLKILDLSVVTLVFQVFWGGLFAELFGMTLGALRLSTVVMVGLGALALYGLCRELGIGRGRSALGAAAYLFNPLSYVLGFTFMSDPHFAAVMTIATYGYVRGLRPGAAGARAMIAGSAVAGLAFLVRQEGALIPPAVVVYLLVSKCLRPNRAGLGLLLRVVALPGAMMALYYLWLKEVHGIPIQQRSFVSSMTNAGWHGTWQLTRWLTFVAAMYLGLFALPIAAAMLVRLPRLVRFNAPRVWILAAAWEAALVAGLAVFGFPGHWPAGTRMPYVPQYLTPWGLGPPDIRAGRPWLIGDQAVLGWATAVCAVASLLLVIALCRTVGAPATPDRAAAGLTLSIGAWQVVGILPPSYHFRTWAVSMDRYLLPLLPFAVCLGLWAVRDLWLPLPIAWLVVAAFAVFSVAGTRDLLVFQEATWNIARQANRAGMSDTKLDAGAAWDGYHLWEYSNAHHVWAHTPHGPWWVYLFAPATDSTYVVATGGLWGYTPVRTVEYSSWLLQKPAYLYLLRRQDAPKPPAAKSLPTPPATTHRAKPPRPTPPPR